MAYGFNSNQSSQSFNQNQMPIPNQNQMPIPNQNIQPLFPQPQGNVYNINSTLEVANVPVGAGVSVALCMPENVMFIKTMQNGNPLFYPYKIYPFNNEGESNTQQNQNTQENAADFAAQIKDCLDRLSKIEEHLTKKKGVEFAI